MELRLRMPQVTRVIFVRHAAPAIHVAPRREAGLSRVGIEGAIRVAEELAKIKIDSIYSSPLPRALQTAEIIGRKIESQITALENLREIELGDWEGLDPDAVRRAARDAAFNFNRAPESFVVPG